MPPLRIFISSPSDVHEERERAKDVVQSLRRRYATKFTLVPVVWEDLPLEPDMSFQQGIDLFLKSPGVDVAIFILWSRIGSALGATIRKADGSAYRSGTEREYDLMIQARAQTRAAEGTPRPRMIVYTRCDNSAFHARLRGETTAKQQEMLSQKELAESFMKETFNDFETGDNISAYHEFNGPVTFTQRLRTHLQAILDDLAGDMNEVIWDVDKQGPPFLGLHAFQPEHADVFCGREEEILEARRALSHQAANGCAFLLLSGASGSGKSSLARAGILPEILAHEPDEEAEIWKSLIITPSELGTDPILGLLTRLSENTLLPELLDQVPSLEKLAADLTKDPAGLFDYSFPKAFQSAETRLGGTARFLLVIDQLEEIFTKDALTKESRAALLALLETFARSGRFWIIATVRSDFYQEIQSEPALVRMKEGRGLLDVLPPQQDAIARLIEEPARLAGLSFEEKDGQPLSTRILRDAAHSPELLPLLEFVLLELFNQDKDKHQLTHATYDSLGGVEGALRRKAETTYNSLTPEAQATLPKILQSLVTLGDDTATGGESDKPVRLRAPLTAFPEEGPARELITAFTAARLFTTAQAESTTEPTVTVTHESLLRVWPRAVQWKDSNIDFLRTRARIATRMKEGSPLLKGDPLLDTAKAFLISAPEGFTPAQRDWIQSSLAKAEAKERQATTRRRIAFAALSLLTIAAATGALLALKQTGIAKKSVVKEMASGALAKTRLDTAVETMLVAAETATAQEEFDEANRWFQRALQAVPDDQDVLLKANLFAYSQYSRLSTPPEFNAVQIPLHLPVGERDGEWFKKSQYYAERLQSFVDRGFLPGADDEGPALWDLRFSQRRRIAIDTSTTPIQMLRGKSIFISVHDKQEVRWNFIEPEGRIKIIARLHQKSEILHLEMTADGAVATLNAAGEVGIHTLDPDSRITSEHYQITPEEALTVDSLAISGDAKALVMVDSGSVIHEVSATFWIKKSNSNQLETFDWVGGIVGYPKIGLSADGSKTWIIASLHANMLLMNTNDFSNQTNYDSVSNSFREAWSIDREFTLRTIEDEKLRKIVRLNIRIGAIETLDFGAYYFGKSCHDLSDDGNTALIESSGIVRWIDIKESNEQRRQQLVGVFSDLNELRIISPGRCALRTSDSLFFMRSQNQEGPRYRLSAKCRQLVTSRSYVVDIDENGRITVCRVPGEETRPDDYEMSAMGHLKADEQYWISPPAPASYAVQRYPNSNLIIQREERVNPGLVDCYLAHLESDHSLTNLPLSFRCYLPLYRDDEAFGATLLKHDDGLTIIDNKTFAQVPFSHPFPAKDALIRFIGDSAIVFHREGQFIIRRKGDEMIIEANHIMPAEKENRVTNLADDKIFIRFFKDETSEYDYARFDVYQLDGHNLRLSFSYNKPDQRIFPINDLWGKGESSEGTPFLLELSSGREMRNVIAVDAINKYALLPSEGGAELFDLSASAGLISFKADEELLRKSFEAGFYCRKLKDGGKLLYNTFGSGVAIILSGSPASWKAEVLVQGNLSEETDFRTDVLTLFKSDPMGLKTQIGKYQIDEEWFLGMPKADKDPIIVKWSDPSTTHPETASYGMADELTRLYPLLKTPDLLTLFQDTDGSSIGADEETPARHRSLQALSASGHPLLRCFSPLISARFQTPFAEQPLHQVLSETMDREVSRDRIRSIGWPEAWHPLSSLAETMARYFEADDPSASDWSAQASDTIERLLGQDSAQPDSPWLADDCGIASRWLTILGPKDDARRLLLHGLKADPNNRRCLIYSLRFNEPSSREWKSYYDTFLKRTDTTAADLLELAHRVAVADLPETSERILEEARIRSASDVDLNLYRGTAAIHRRDGKKALDLINRVQSTLKPEDRPSEFLIVASICARWLTGDTESVLQEYKNMIDDDPRSWAEESPTKTYFPSYDPVEIELREEIRKATLERFPELHRGAGYRHRLEQLKAGKDFVGMLSAFRGLRDSENATYQDLIEGGYMATRLELAAEAEAFFRQASVELQTKLNSPSERKKIIAQLGWICIIQSKNKEALDYFVEAVEENSNIDNLLGLSTAYWINDRHAEALEVFLQAVRIDPRWGDPDNIDKHADPTATLGEYWTPAEVLPLRAIIEAIHTKKN